MARRKRKQKNKGGVWVLEIVGLVAFGVLLMLARSERDSTMIEQDSAHQPSCPVSQFSEQQDVEESTLVGWKNHRPRFSQVIGDIWNAGF